MGNSRGTLRPDTGRAHTVMRHRRRTQTLDLHLHRPGFRIPAKNLPVAVPAGTLYRGTNGCKASPYARKPTNHCNFSWGALANHSRRTSLAMEKYADLP